ncbi:NAD(P)-dependent oxidoreductase [Spiractinospora alimapuensis]|uniref:NAD(P)-dependent oxidoreductase n=1 Tax=Spiractinospora alimapuensis TaxID=2820884 RepID=UPI001F2DC4FC|nr:NAD(P)-dependent oxidoreductase [Spiractinospora alimapuensis]
MSVEQHRPGETSVAFVGLGIMGEPMARNLLTAGFAVTVHNRSQPAMDRLRAAGASTAASPAEAAENADVTILMLPDAPDVRAVVLGDDGVASTARPGSLVIDMSTISAEETKELAARLEAKDIHLLDAPVSGGQTGAVEATLTVMVGGAEEDVRRAWPILTALGTTVTHLGGTGAGQLAKAANQIVVAGTIQAVAEALTLMRHSGVDAGQVREALPGGLAGSKILQVHGQRMVDGVYEPGFRARLHHKDLGIALEAGAAAGVPLATTSLVHQFLGSLVASGRGDEDHSALARVVDGLAGGSNGGHQ